MTVPETPHRRFRARRIYLASSWRNERYPSVLAELRAAGHKVFDFRNPWVQGPDAETTASVRSGFHWSELDPNWKNWSPERYRVALEHPLAIAGFRQDHAAMRWADTFVLVLPCGASAHLEAGWACGAGKQVFALLEPGLAPELMYREILLTGGQLALNLPEMISLLSEPAHRPRGDGGAA